RTSGEATNDGTRRPHRRARVPEQPSLLVHPVQAPPVDERERTPLLDTDHDPVRELAHDVGPPDLRQGLDPVDHVRGIEPEDVRPTRYGGCRPNLLRWPARPAP